MGDNILKRNGKTIFKQFVGAAFVTFLSLLPLALLLHIFEEGEQGSFLQTFSFVLGGKLFQEDWNPIHAGSALDQPTIGKWFFWFTVFAVVCLSYMMLVRRFCVGCSKLRHWIFAIGLAAICLFLACLLTIPFWWLVQYVLKMGWTPKRLFGLIYGICGYGTIVVFWYRSVICKNTIKTA